MARALRTTLESSAQWTADELLAHLVDAEWDDRHARRLQRLLKAARFRYLAAIEEWHCWRCSKIATVEPRP